MLSYKKILVPIDFSAISRKATLKALNLKDIKEGELVLTHIIDYMPPPYAAIEMPASLASDELMIERAEEHLDTLIEELNVGVCTKIVKVGRARRSLSNIVDDNQIDLVVMGKHNQKGIGRMMGSTTQHMVQHAECDVLVIHDS